MILQSRYFNPIMYLAISIITILIVFTLGGIYQEAKITGNVIANTTDSNETSKFPENTELYTIQAYTFFYLGIVSLILIASLIGLSIILPKIKNYT